jgi:RimJ/RimL family protein N-acetyltransferase
LLIETADIDDVDEILLLQKEVKTYNDFEIPPLIETLDELKLLFRNHIFLKATIDGKIVGSVRASLNKDTCHIGRLIVNPAFQNQGIGTKLLAEIEQKCSACKRFELFTGIRSARTIHLYEKNGYKAFKTEWV